MIKTGRKKLFEHLTKVGIKMDQKDRERLKKHAKDEGLSLSAYLRKHGLMSIREILYDIANNTSITPIDLENTIQELEMLLQQKKGE